MVATFFVARYKPHITLYEKNAFASGSEHALVSSIYSITKHWPTLAKEGSVRVTEALFLENPRKAGARDSGLKRPCKWQTVFLNECLLCSETKGYFDLLNKFSNFSYAQAAGATPRIPLGELTALSQTPTWRGRSSLSFPIRT